LRPCPVTDLSQNVPVTVTTNVFNPCFQNFFWNYDNHGLKLLQLRFYSSRSTSLPTRSGSVGSI
jgi:hypothetical protein